MELGGLLDLIEALFGVRVALFDEFADLVHIGLLLVDEGGEVSKDLVDLVDVLVYLSDLLLAFPEDRVVDLQIQRCRSFMVEPPPDDWSGLTVLSKK